MIKSDLETIIEHDFQMLMQKHKLKNLNFKYFKKRYIFLNFILVVITFFLWFLLLAIIMGMPLSFLKGLLELGIAGKIILVFSSLVTLSLGICLFTKYYQAAKLQKIIMQELPFEKFYQIGLNALAKKNKKTKKQYQIATITQKFNLFPRVRVPNTKDLKEDYVINFYENDINYSFGTLTRREVNG